MSAPMVTGAAAFLYSYRTDLQLSDIRKVLLETARKIPPLEGKLSSNGMLDVYAALNYGRTTENADSAQSEQGAADSAQAEQSAEQTAGTAQESQGSDSTSDGAAQSESTASTSKTITAGGGESVNLGW